MASLFRLADGRKRIQFYDGNGKRRSVGLGSISNRNAERIRDKVEQLVEHRVTQTPLDPSVSRWLASLDEKLHARLVKAGLAETRVKQANRQKTEPSAVSLVQFLDSYLRKRTDVKESTRTVYRQVRRNLLECLGNARALVEITPGDADDFVRFLKSNGLSPVTVNRRCSLAKTIFRDAFRRKLISQNPFTDIKAGTRSNSERQRFISREDIEKIIENAPDAEWRLMIALARFGGLRIPSELMMIQWSDIDWQRKRIRITSPKTEHHQGKESRQLPLFPELVAPLQDVWDQAEHQKGFVITKNRPASVRNGNGNWQQVNIRTRFTKIIKLSGLEPWPRLWQNLRSSRETELAHEYPLHIVTAWLGNSEAVATKHYLQVTDADFEQASTPSIAAPPEKTVRKPVRHGHATPRTDSQDDDDNGRFSAGYNEKRPHARTCDRSGWRIGDSNP